AYLGAVAQHDEPYVEILAPRGAIAPVYANERAVRVSPVDLERDPRRGAVTVAVRRDLRGVRIEEHKLTRTELRLLERVVLGVLPPVTRDGFESPPGWLVPRAPRLPHVRPGMRGRVVEQVDVGGDAHVGFRLDPCEEVVGKTAGALPRALVGQHV